MTIQPRFAALLCTTLLLSHASGAPEKEFPRFASVEMQVLMKDYHRTNQAQREMNIERGRIQQASAERLDTISRLEDDLITMRKQLDDPALSDRRKQELFKSFQMKSQEGVALDREHREYLQRRTTALNEKMMLKMRELLNEIRKMVADHARAENISYVFDRSGLSTNQVPILLYAKDATDLTPVLLKILNKDAPEVSKTAKAPEKP
jgi:Skp family chaperone for outer membrane proteins